MGASTKGVTRDLTNAQVSGREQICAPGLAILSVFVLSSGIPSGASFQLQFGENGPIFTIDGPIEFEPDGDEGIDGLFFINSNAQPGVKVTFYFSATSLQAPQGGDPSTASQSSSGARVPVAPRVSGW